MLLFQKNLPKSRFYFLCSAPCFECYAWEASIGVHGTRTKCLQRCFCAKCRSDFRWTWHPYLVQERRDSWWSYYSVQVSENSNAARNIIVQYYFWLVICEYFQHFMICGSLPIPSRGSRGDQVGHVPQPCKVHPRNQWMGSFVSFNWAPSWNDIKRQCNWLTTIYFLTYY